MSGDEEGSSLRGWIVFVLIFAIGNALLYYFANVFIPMPRR